MKIAQDTCAGSSKACIIALASAAVSGHSGVFPVRGGSDESHDPCHYFHLGPS